MKMLSKFGMAAMALSLLTSAASADMIQIKGSDTIVNLVQKLAEVYMQQNPGVKIAVTGGGSGTGIAAVINKKCDIGNASRAISAKEIELASTAGVNPSRVVIAIDGLSVIVNPQIGVDKLTRDQVGAIYRGKIKNWSEVGGPDMPITLYGRQSNSGTYGFFREVVLKGEYSPQMRSMNGNAQIVESVKADPSGIGYVGVGYVKNGSGFTILNIAFDEKSEYVSPLNESAVDSGTYPIARPLYQYVGGTVSGAVKDFMKFETSAEGQKIVEEEGFFKITDEYRTLNERVGL